MCFLERGRPQQFRDPEVPVGNTWPSHVLLQCWGEGRAPGTLRMHAMPNLRPLDAKDVLQFFKLTPGSHNKVFLIKVYTVS